MKRIWLLGTILTFFVTFSSEGINILAEDSCPVHSIRMNDEDSNKVLSGSSKWLGIGCEAILEIQNQRSYWANVKVGFVGNGVQIRGKTNQDERLIQYQLIPPQGTIYYQVRFTGAEQTVTISMDVTSNSGDAAREANLAQALLDLLSLTNLIKIDTTLTVSLFVEHYPELRNALNLSPHLFAASAALIGGDLDKSLAEMEFARQAGEITRFANVLKDIGFSVSEEVLIDLADKQLGESYINALQIIWKNYSNVFKLLTEKPAGFIEFIAEGENSTLIFVTPTIISVDLPDVYQVAFVASNDTLNVRSGAGVNHDVVGTLTYNATGIHIVGAEQSVENSVWVPIAFDDVNGWVNRYYLTQAVDSNTFCSQTASRSLLDQSIKAFKFRDGNLLQSVINPLRGLLIRHNWWNTEVRLRGDDVSVFFDDTTVRNWGSADGSGRSIDGSAVQIILPLIDKDLLNGTQISCNQIVGGGTSGLLQLPPEYETLNFYSIYRPAPDNQDHFADWGTWVIGVEYWDDKPLISYLVHYEWEI